MPGMTAPRTLSVHEEMRLFGGVLALCDAQHSDREVLRELSRLWLTPGRQGIGMLMLRSGERIEVPWRATTLIMCDSPVVADVLGDAVEYVVDASSITGRAMQAFLTQRLPDARVLDLARRYGAGYIVLPARRARPGLTRVYEFGSLAVYASRP